MTESSDTKYASPERSSPAELDAREHLIRGRELFVKALDILPKIVMVLDKNRQIVYYNKALEKLFNVPCSEILGKRPGELLRCIHAWDEHAGCGTSSFCRECGAVKAIVSSLEGQQTSEECRITVDKCGKTESMDLRVWTVPFDAEGERFVIFTVEDIANEKRREALESTFFHDLLNEAAVLLGYLDNMIDDLMPLSKENAAQMRHFAKGVVQTVQSHRDLTAAEEGRLRVQISEFDVRKFLEKLIQGYASSSVAKSRHLVLDARVSSCLLKTDATLLGRVMGNLVKNALEATAEGSTVTVSHRREGGKQIFSVHNPEVMPEQVRLQVFQRSFSTKGRGRGLGTYSVKYFTENYLGGKVHLESEIGKGTIFFVELNETFGG